MAHEITDTDNLFSVRAETWHGLGEILNEYPDRAEAQQIAHPWEPVSEPIYRCEPALVGGELVEQYTEVPGSKAIVRDDNAALLGINNVGYEPVTNDELWDIAELIQGETADVRYETGGSLKGGARVWLLLRLNEPIGVPGDPHGATIPYYLLQNSHDGSSAFRGQATNVRVVCANTSKAADIDSRARGTE